MKRTIISILCVLFFFLMLSNPNTVLSGTENGLLLWFQVVLPTLFPYMFMTNILIYTNGLSYITHVVSPIICPIFRISKVSSFAVIAGFLCGYPLGAKIAAELCFNKKISSSEAQYLLSFCNNTSPVFIINFISWKVLQAPRYAIPAIMIVFLSALLMGLIFRKFYIFPIQHETDETSPNHTNSSWGIDVFEKCMMNSIESIVLIGGNIIIFSVFIQIFSNTFPNYILAAFEISNGILMLSRFKKPLNQVFILALTSFGGICSITQTKCMLSGTKLKISHYIIQKLATAMVTSLFAIIYFYLQN